MAILVAYEDTYCRELDRALRRVLRHRHGKLHVRREVHSVKGVGNFVSFVKKEWPLFRDVGYPSTGSPRMEHVVCVVDADRLAKHLGKSGAPKKDTGAWVKDIESAFETGLRESVDGSGVEVCGVALRWNYESVVVAAHDDPIAFRLLAGQWGWKDDEALDPFFRACTPLDPRETDDAGFVEHFRRPQKCLEALAKHMGCPKLKKGDTRKDDVVDAFAIRHPDVLQVRVPDLARLADCVAELCQRE